MSEGNERIASRDCDDFRLRPIDKGDIEELRIWKNSHKDSFFLKREITEDQQAGWFAEFVTRDDDHMFIVEQRSEKGWEKIGCMGFRHLIDEGCVDVYNIMRSRKIEPSTFAMSDPFRTMLKYAESRHPQEPIRCKVLLENPAVAWYERNGFKKISEHESYFLMELDKSKIADIDLALEL
jgi:hypothetical protein